MSTMADDQRKPEKIDRRRSTSSDEEKARIRAAFIEWVQHILDQKNWTPTDLANRSDVAASTILRILNSDKHPFNISFLTIRKVADGSGYPVPRSLMEAHGLSEGLMPKGDLEVKSRIHTKPAASNEAAPAMVARMIPLRHISSLPSKLAPKVADGQEPCPPQMDGDETAFAFLMPDDSLSPAIWSGMKVFATKRRDPAQGDIVLLTDKDGRTRVRIVEEVDEDGFHLERIHPARKEEVMAFDDVDDFAVVDGVWRR